MEHRKHRIVKKTPQLAIVDYIADLEDNLFNLGTFDREENHEVSVLHEVFEVGQDNFGEKKY